MTLPQSSQVDPQILEKSLTRNRTTSYKLFWFSGIMKEIQSGNQLISFRKIVHYMISDAWYPLIEHNLNFGKVDKLYELVILIHRRYNIESHVKEEELLFFLDHIKDEDVEKRISKLHDYVPYRLLTEFLDDKLVNLSDRKKNAIIEKMSNSQENILYRINSEEKFINIQEDWYKYIYDNQEAISKWLNDEKVEFLQKRNPKVKSIENKI